MDRDPSKNIMTLVAEARGGRASALEDIFQTILPELRAFVRLQAGERLRQRESSSDLVQSVCRDVLGDLAQFRGAAAGEFKKWLFTIALRKIQQKGRFHAAEKRDRGREVSAGQSSSDSSRPGDEQLLNCYQSICTPSRHVAAKEEVSRIEQLFDRLPESYRRVITLACFLGLSHAEVAKEMGKTESATRTLLARARAQLAFHLAQDRRDRDAE